MVLCDQVEARVFETKRKAELENYIEPKWLRTCWLIDCRERKICLLVQADCLLVGPNVLIDAS
jgi:hypothetical protein